MSECTELSEYRFFCCGLCFFLGAVRGVRQGVDPGRRAVQATALRSDRDAGQHYVHSDVNEPGPLPRDLSPYRLVRSQ